MRRWLVLVPPLIGVVLFTLAAWTLHHQLLHHSYRDIVTALRAISWRRIAPAIGVTALGYLTLPLYDVIALRYVRESLQTARIFFTSFVAYTFSQNLGFPLFTGTSVRYRFYTSWGIPVGQLARAIAFSSVTFWIGVVALVGAALLGQPRAEAALVGLPADATRLVGVAMLGLVLGYLGWNALAHRPLRLLGRELRVPGLRLALAQLTVSVTDWTLAALVLYLLLPRDTAVGFPTVLGAFLVAQTLGVISHVPGGLGVFESALLVLLGPRVANSAVVATLVAYRVVYYLLPLSVALVLLGGYEISRQRQAVAVGLRFVGRWIPHRSPRLLASATFIAGAVLLFSGATPAIGSRLAGLDRFFPLAVIEVSHFVGSVAGTGLVLLALGLERRLDAAWHFAIGLLGLGVVASLLRGLDYEEATFLFLVLAVLVPSRGAFYRRTALTAEPFSPGWLVAVVLVMATSIWLGMFAYRHVTYSQELWWQFTLRGDAPRFLRASVGVLATAGAAALWRLLRPSVPRGRPTPTGDLERALPIVQASGNPSAMLALLGDKSLVFNPEGSGFVMYGTAGQKLGRHGRPGGSPRGPGPVGLAVPRTGGPAFRLVCVLRGWRRGPSHLPGPRAPATQDGRRSQGSPFLLLARGGQPAGFASDPPGGTEGRLELPRRRAGHRRGIPPQAGGDLRCLAGRQTHPGEGILPRLLRPGLSPSLSHRPGRTGGSHRGLRQHVADRRTGGNFRGPHAPRARGAHRRHGIPVHRGHALGPGPGLC